MPLTVYMLRTCVEVLRTSLDIAGGAADAPGHDTDVRRGAADVAGIDASVREADAQAAPGNGESVEFLCHTTTDRSIDSNSATPECGNSQAPSVRSPVSMPSI